MVAKTEKKDEKTSLGSKILNYVPWRTALTIAAFAIPVAGPILGIAVGALTYGNYRKNNRTENPVSNNGPDNKESKRESVQPGRLEKLASQAGTIAKRIGVIAIGFLLGGPIGGIIAAGLMVIDGISGGKLIQGAEKTLDTGYDVLSAAGKGILDAGRQAVDKMKGSEKEAEEKSEPASPKVKLKGDEKEVGSAEQLVKGGKAEAELRRRESSANQERIL